MIDLYSKAVSVINSGGIVLLKTDTQYGLLAGIYHINALDNIRSMKKRDGDKPFIILVRSIEDLFGFGISINKETHSILKEIWPGPVSVIFDCPFSELSHLHLGSGSCAFRIPNKDELLELLSKTGPLVAPSANIQGENPVFNSEEAEEIFGSNVDLYINEGRCKNDPSDIIKIGEEIKVLRGGRYVKEKLNI